MAFRIPSFLNDSLMAGVDLVYALLPRPKPPVEKLKNVKIVAHRGIHEPLEIKENTWHAFDLALEQKVWGIEFDIRFTQDQVPVVLHDADPYRVFPEIADAKQTPLRALDYQDLVRMNPEIPSLEAMIERYKKRLHFFIEIKEALNTPEKKAQMKNLLGKLKPIEDFHLMSLDLKLFEDFDFLPKACFLPVAEWNIATCSNCSIVSGWAGVTGHYLLVSDKRLFRHSKAGQLLGTGFINSKNLLYREINRGVEYVFTDRALSIKALLDKALNS